MNKKIPARLVARVMARNEEEKAMRYLEKMLRPIERHTGMKVLHDGMLTDEFMAILPKLKDTSTTTYKFAYCPSVSRGHTATLKWRAAIKVKFDGAIETDGVSVTFAYIQGGRMDPCVDGMFGGARRLKAFINARKFWATVQKSRKIEAERNELYNEITNSGITTWGLGECHC